MIGAEVLDHLYDKNCLSNTSTRSKLWWEEVNKELTSSCMEKSVAFWNTDNIKRSRMQEFGVYVGQPMCLDSVS